MSNFTEVPNLKKSPLLIIAVVIVGLILVAALFTAVKTNPLGIGLILCFLIAIIVVAYEVGRIGKKKN